MSDITPSLIGIVLALGTIWLYEKFSEYYHMWYFSEAGSKTRTAAMYKTLSAHSIAEYMRMENYSKFWEPK
jgi:hypothetical protein